MTNKEIEHGVDSTEQELMGGYNESRIYELGFHIDPELPQEEVKKTYQSIKASIEKVGTLVAQGEPQKIPLAYTISQKNTQGRRDFDSAYFAWIAYEAAGEGHQAVLDMANSETRIIRFLDIKTTREQAKHSEEMHEIMLKIPEPVLEEEVQDAELDQALKDALV
jgi:ribosomal protein S6